MKRKRRAAALLTAGAVASLGLVAGFWFWARPGVQSDLESLPYDTPVKQTIVRDDGSSFGVELTKRYVPDEELPRSILPQPAPRRASPDERNESSRALTGLALQAWHEGKTREAIAHFQEAIAADPNDAEPRTNYGRMLIFLAGYVTAREHLERAAELRPDDPQVWLDLRTLYEKSLLLERAWYARKRAEELAGSRRITQDEHGFWLLEGNSVLP